MSWRATAVGRRALTWAAGGAALALVLLSAGWVYTFLAFAFGTRRDRLEATEFLHGVGWYVLGFTVAGALLGAFRPLARQRWGRYALSLLGAGCVMLACGVILSGSIDSWDDATWFAVAGCALFFGIAFGRDRTLFD